MDKRVQAAAIALASGWEDEAKYYVDEAKSAVEAADSVMFSEEMHALIANILWESRDYTWQVQASKVFEALKAEA